ncbi:MAG TPA: TrbI/VirB10 family protein [Nitrospira sp.]|nr:TrbI/VirB10 family protein [Nitrospira sp.]
MNPGQGGMGDKLLGGQAELNPFGGQSSTVARWKVLAVVGAVLAVGTVALQSLRADPTPEPVGIGGKPASKPATLNPRAEKEAWIGEAAGRVRKTEERQQMLDQQMKEFRDEMRRKDEQIEKLIKEHGAGPSSKVAGLAPSAQGTGRMSILPPPQSALPPQPILASSARPTPGGAPAAAANPSRPTQGFQPIQPQAQINRIRVFSPDPQPAQGPGAPTKYWIPTGTMVPVKLLTGLDAPGKSAATGGEPHPVLMFAEDMSVLPNNVQMDMRECFVLGEGIGDLSEERAKIRAVSLSCVKKDEQSAVDIRLRGVLTGEDGKIGLRGPVVQREGAILAKALLAGFVQGISRVFMPYQQGFFIAPSPQQAFNFPDPGQVAMAGVAGGMGGAAQTLARHYTQLAKEIYPIIEIDAGRQGTLIVTEGREIAEAPQ